MQVRSTGESKPSKGVELSMRVNHIAVAELRELTMADTLHL